MVVLFPAKGRLDWQEVVLQCMVECVMGDGLTLQRGGVQDSMSVVVYHVGLGDF